MKEPDNMMNKLEEYCDKHNIKMKVKRETDKTWIYFSKNDIEFGYCWLTIVYDMMITKEPLLDNIIKTLKQMEQV